MRVLVTGGGGFLGKAIVTRLRSSGVDVCSLSRGDYPELQALGAECLRGDVADADTVLRAAAGCELVFHVAARAGVWGRYEDYHRANVVGTENVLAACRFHQIPRLVYTSSPSVVFNGQDEMGANESVPYPQTYLTHYPQTKAIAERAVLQANGETLSNGGRLSTVALRPHLIWGPGDNHLLPRLIERARQGKLRRVGTGTNLVDTVYIDNAADAHLLAAEKLSADSPAAGNAYFITNGEPLPLWDLINRMLACADLPPVQRRISAGAAYLAGSILEAVYRWTGRTDEPPMTRFVARQLATAHWFDITAARKDLGYAPKVTVDEGLQRLADWLHQ
ncbi:MAG: NAD-dependent epimerase/dehydratase family protein [Planctomycetes bacterium]|nr:NAD-dependent epimerase/dehydratase family protein [Planctomycetota bacterium]